ncbi:hypothetical protein HDU84_002897 [Entophlyctis sp. JEL0112]|nr:hypothetical protein HDU84_002897 [Entophlyctis sp. JEL0112]
MEVRTASKRKLHSRGISRHITNGPRPIQSAQQKDARFSQSRTDEREIEDSADGDEDENDDDNDDGISSDNLIDGSSYDESDSGDEGAQGNGEIDDGFGKPAKKTKLGTDAKYRVPTNDEIQALKETTDLFQSNLFRLQIDELLKEVVPDYTRTGSLDKTLHSLKAVLDSCRELPELDLLAAKKSVAKSNIVIPFAAVDAPAPDSTRYKFSFKPPAKVFIAGSYLVKTIAKSGSGFNVDVAVQMPESIFVEKDHLNNRYFHKRAYYLAVLASALKASSAFKSAKISFELLNKDPRRPVIVLNAKGKETFGSVGGVGGVSIRVIPVVPQTLFPVHKLAPGRNNNRPAAELNSESQFPPTPRYNSAILMDISLVSSLNVLHKQSAACPAFKDAVILGKVWLYQRGFDSSSFGGFLWSMLVCYLMGPGNRTVNKGRGIILRESFSSYQIVKLTIEFLATHNFSEAPIFMTPDGSPIENEDFSAKALTSHFDCVIVDPSGRLNLAAYVNSSTLNHLQFEAKSSLSLFNELGSDRFEPLFLKKITDPVGYFDSILRPLTSDDRINKIPPGFAGYKPSVQIDWPSKRQFFVHFVSRLLRLGIKSRTKLIKLMDFEEQPKNICWSLNESPPDEDDNLPMLVGLVLNYETAYEPVEQGPASGEDEKIIENFRRLWGTKASLRRFADGSIAESVVWEVGSDLDERVFIAGKMASYLISRHVSVRPEDLSFWGDQFLNTLKEFGGDETSAKATTRNHTFLEVTNAFDEFAKAVKGLDGIPLEITSVVASDDGLRNCSTFAIQPSIAGDSSNRLHPILRDRINVLIEFEDSSKWPSDTIPALQYLKLAFLIKLAELLTAQYPGVRATVSKPDIIDLTTGVITVRMKNGYEFCARIKTGRELKLAAIAVKNAHISGDAALKAAAQKRFDAVDRVFRMGPKHSQWYQNLHFRHPQLSTTVRLTKRWLAAHWLLADCNGSGTGLRGEAVEALVAGTVFCETAPYANPPSAGAFSGFVRVLRVFADGFGIAETAASPSAVPVVAAETDRGEIPAEKLSAVQRSVSAATSTTPGAPIAILTAYDESGVCWTKDSGRAGTTILKRIRQLARASLKLIKESITSGDDSEIAKIFITPTDGFDYVIQLDVAKLPTYHKNIAYDPDKLPQAKSKFRNLASLEKDPLYRFLEEVNPAEQLVKNLEATYGNVASFFYDVNGGDRVGVLLNKKIVIPEQPWKPTIPYCVEPVVTNSSQSVDDEKGTGNRNDRKKSKAIVSPDYRCLEAEFQRLGAGIVTSVANSHLQ